MKFCRQFKSGIQYYAMAVDMILRNSFIIHNFTRKILVLKIPSGFIEFNHKIVFPKNVNLVKTILLYLSFIQKVNLVYFRTCALYSLISYNSTPTGSWFELEYSHVTYLMKDLNVSQKKKCGRKKAAFGSISYRVSQLRS